ncbi:MAG: hypothetical protein ACERKO_03995 [Acetanaerobacterium sp.]
MRWIDKAKDVARSYRSNNKELSLLLESQERGIRAANIASMRSGRISRPVEAAVVAKLSNERMVYLKQAIFAVDYAIAKAREKPQGEITVRLYEMVYRDRTHMLFGAAAQLHISDATARRYNQFFLKIIAVQMGFVQIF